MDADAVTDPSESPWALFPADIGPKTNASKRQRKRSVWPGDARSLGEPMDVERPQYSLRRQSQRQSIERGAFVDADHDIGVRSDSRPTINIGAPLSVDPAASLDPR